MLAAETNLGIAGTVGLGYLLGYLALGSSQLPEVGAGAAAIGATILLGAGTGLVVAGVVPGAANQFPSIVFTQQEEPAEPSGAPCSQQ